jgi:large subunit ribosomal protein L15
MATTLSNLRPAAGSVRTNTRKGRGTGSGKGGTSTRGHKGAQSRSGYSAKAGFEGGQMPLQRRVPKFGFTSINKIYYKVVNLSLLQELSESYPGQALNLAFFKQHGLISKNNLLKILGNGELTASVAVEAHGFSATAKAAIEKAGGTSTVFDIHAKAEIAA